MMEYEVVRKIFAYQLSAFIEHSKNVFIAGIPTGATKLAKDIAEITGFGIIKMEKDEEGKIQLTSCLPFGSMIIFIEDVSTQRTAIREAYQKIYNIFDVEIAPYILTVIDRADSDENNFFVKNGELVNKSMTIKSLVKITPKEWDVENFEFCPLCGMGSIPMSPKNPAENWNNFQ